VLLGRKAASEARADVLFYQLLVPSLDLFKYSIVVNLLIPTEPKNRRAGGSRA